MSPDPTTREIARARLALITAADPVPPGPRRALEPDPQDAIEPDLPDRLTGNGPAGPAGMLVDVSRRHLVVVALILLCGVGFAVVSLTSSRASPVPVVSPDVRVTSPSPSPQPTPMLRVHVLGAVREPGVVVVPLGSIVDDALAAAGGLQDQADVGDLNLAAPLSDGQQVVVGTTVAPRGEVIGGSGGDAGPAGAPVDLNRASTGQLEELPGVGPVLAGAIIAHREQHGPFTSVSQLQEVAGIGAKTFARLEPLVRV